MDDTFNFSDSDLAHICELTETTFVKPTPECKHPNEDVEVKHVDIEEQNKGFDSDEENMVADFDWF